jgi:uncharacterized protein (DUF58 family)
VLDDPVSELIAYPRLGRLTIGWTRRYGEAAHGSRRVMHRQGRMEGDYHGLRDFRSGDSRRWIHWRTSARRGELMVRQFEQQRNQDLCLLVELWQMPQPTPRELESVELAVSFAATIISDRCRRAGSYLLCATAGQQPSFTRGPASSALLQESLESLAVAEAGTADHLPKLLEQSLEVIRPATSIVIISTRPVDIRSPRFAQVWHDPRKKNWSGKVLAIDTSSEQLGEYFVME